MKTGRKKEIIRLLSAYALHLSTRPDIIFDSDSQKLLEHIYQTIMLLNSKQKINKVFKIELIVQQLSFHKEKHAIIGEIVKVFKPLIEKKQLSDNNNNIESGFRNKS